MQQQDVDHEFKKFCDGMDEQSGDKGFVTSSELDALVCRLNIPEKVALEYLARLIDSEQWNIGAARKP